jgi:hypothetical protein
VAIKSHVEGYLIVKPNGLTYVSQSEVSSLGVMGAGGYVAVGSGGGPWSGGERLSGGDRDRIGNESELTRPGPEAGASSPLLRATK